MPLRCCIHFLRRVSHRISYEWYKSLRSACKTLLSIAFIYALTFGIVLPFTCSGRPYSQFITGNKDDFLEKVRSKNEDRRLKAENYLRSLDPTAIHNFFDTRLHESNLDILIAVTTVTRRTAEGYELGYFKQVAAALIHEIQKYNSSRVALIICNVDANPDFNRDAKYISQFIPSTARNLSGQPSIYEKEKQDYLFCLQKCHQYNSRYILIVEDDTLPHSNFLHTLNFILKNSLERKIQRGILTNNIQPWLALKLYYPERWLGFAFEVRQLSELIGIALVGCLFFLKIISCFSVNLQQNWIVCFVLILGAFYFICFSLLIGRPNLLELRRIHPSFYNVMKAPGCCTPATLYPKSVIPNLIRYLNGIVCNKDFGLDIAIDEHSNFQKLNIHSVEPNLFTHIGFYSSLTKTNKENPEEFLFGSSAIDDLPVLK